MERFTDKNHNAINKCGEYSSCYSCHKEICYIKEIEDKLGELEDVLEKYGIESTEELDGVLKPLIDNGELENWKSAIFWKTQTERLTQELTELKQKAIASKFEPFQKIYVLIYNDEGKCSIIEHIYSGYSVNYCARERIWIQCTDTDNSYMLSNCFVTKEEAEQKLAEIKGKKDE